MVSVMSLNDHYHKTPLKHLTDFFSEILIEDVKLVLETVPTTSFAWIFAAVFKLPRKSGREWGGRILPSGVRVKWSRLQRNFCKFVVLSKPKWMTWWLETQIVLRAPSSQQIVSDFGCMWPLVIPFAWTPYYKSVIERSNVFIAMIIIGFVWFNEDHDNWHWSGILWLNIRPLTLQKVSWGHMWPANVSLSITFDDFEIETK